MWRTVPVVNGTGDISRHLNGYNKFYTIVWFRYNITIKKYQRFYKTFTDGL